jgi:hypothetical protein
MRKFYLFIFACLLAVPAHAQDMPYREIFTDAVQIIDFEVLEMPPIPTHENPTQVNIHPDNQRRILRVYSEASQSSREYVYPQGTGGISPEFYDFDEAGGVLRVFERFYDGRPIYSTGWDIDLRTGVWARVPMTCGEPPAPADQGEFRVYGENGVIYLCNTASGNIGEPLDPALDWDVHFGSVPTRRSPDGNTIIYWGNAGCVGASGCPYTLFAYSIPENRSIELGVVRSDDGRNFSRWDGLTIDWLNDNRHVILTAYETSSSGQTSYYFGDAATANSIEHLRETYDAGQVLYTSTHFEWVEGCVLRTIDLENGARQDYDLEGICTLGTPLHSGNRLFYLLNYGEDNNVLSARLLTFNPLTGERRDLLEGEIEGVLDVSPDGNFAILVMDNSGALEMQGGYSGNTSHPRMGILDLRTAEFIYEIDTRFTHERIGMLYYSPRTGGIYNDFAALTGSPLVLEDDLLALGFDHFVHVPDWQTMNFITLDEGIPEVAPIIGQPLLTFGNQQLVFITGDSVQVYDPDTGVITPIIEVEIVGLGDFPTIGSVDFSLNLERDAQNIQYITVTISPDNEPNRRRFRYTIAVP